MGGAGRVRRTTISFPRKPNAGPREGRTTLPTARKYTLDAARAAPGQKVPVRGVADS